MNYEREGWKYTEIANAKCWMSIKHGVEVFQFTFNDKVVWEFALDYSDNRWNSYPDHITTVEERLAYALAVARLQGGNDP